MAQILDSIPQDQPERLLCCYVNATNKIQVARITNLPNWYFERVVFPGQKLLFEAPQEGLLEIHTGMMASSILSDTIPCERLAIEDDRDMPPSPFHGAKVEPPVGQELSERPPVAMVTGG